MLAEEKNRLYQMQIQQMTEADLSEEVQSTLKELRARGHLLAIGSSGKNTPLILEKLGLSDFFDAVADGTQITHSRPDPEVFLLAAAKLGIKPEEALVIEDATSGIQAAYSGGFCAIGLCSEKNLTIRRLTSLLDILQLFRRKESDWLERGSWLLSGICGMHLRFHRSHTVIAASSVFPPLLGQTSMWLTMWIM